MNHDRIIDWSGPKRQPCPNCGRGPTDRALSVTVKAGGNGMAHCFRCGYKETVHGTALAAPKLRPTGGQKHDALSDYGREMWQACKAISGDAAAYLTARQCMLPPRDGDLRWHPALKHPPSGLLAPALVALVTDAVTGKPLTLHRTWVCADGTKAAVVPPRMLLGQHRKAGGVVRLWPDEAVSTGLGVAEGIETALSLAHGYQPVWSLIDAGNLKTFAVLPGIGELLIAADHDQVGIAAANACATRWHRKGVTARVMLPESLGSDWNDEVRGS